MNRYLSFVFLVPFLVPFCFSVNAQNGSLQDILTAINKLEAKSEPKCYATASRLEDFMFGTPLDNEARFAKNILQKELIESLWKKGSELAILEKENVILEAHIQAVSAELFKVSINDNDHWQLGFNNQQNLTLHKDDKRQYASIAYSLRAVLAVQQELLLDFDNDLLPLSSKAIDMIKDTLDFYTLAVLKIADNKAKLNDQRLISIANISQTWQGLLSIEPPELAINPSQTAIDYKPIKPNLLLQMADIKLDAYAQYNRVSNQLFLRNLQVYFARVTWPKEQQQADKIINVFSSLMTEFSRQLYEGAQQLAMQDGQRVIKEQDIYQFSQQFIPHKINEYEDALFFPMLAKHQQTYIESYDMDAFRDAGVHWQYLLQGINNTEFTIYLEPDPFAAELLVENIAQYGVLLFRIAGEQVLKNDKDRLNAEFLISAQKVIEQRIQLHSNAKPNQQQQQSIGSSKAPSVSNKLELRFSEISGLAGIDYHHRTSDWLNRQLRTFIKTGANLGNITIPPAFGGSGVAVEDINNNGLMDILLLGGRGLALYINQGDGTYQERSKEFGLQWKRHLDDMPGEMRQPIIADIDNDGWQDIVITFVNDKHRVYRNVKGKQFDDLTMTAALGGENLVGGPATVFDMDNDGDLDIYITYFGNYLKGELPTLKRYNTNGSPNQLFENLGNFQFKNVTHQSGLDNTGWAQAVAHTDLNKDNWQDIIVGNDFGTNGYYVNQGNNTFKEVSASLNTDKPSYTMGIGITDLNADQLPDLYISNIVTMNKDETYVLPNQDTRAKFDADKLASMRVVEANDLFLSLNSKDLSYENSTLVERGYSSTGWSWDGDFFDYDLDGDDDLYVLNGMNEFNVYSSKNPYYQDPDGNHMADILIPVSPLEKNVFFENHGGKLNYLSQKSGLDVLSNSRSASYFDHDNDGDLDIIVNNYHESALLFINNLDKSERNWLKVKLTGDPKQKVTRDAIGAKLLVILPSGQKIWREIRSTDGYMSVHPKQQHFGVGSANEVDIEVTWPNGKIQIMSGVKANQILEVAL
jgi:hypothetical protein